MELNDVGIVLEIVGFLIALPTSRYILMSLATFVYVYSQKKSFLKIEENREPKGFKENYEKETRINNEILEVWKRIMNKWPPDEINKTNYSKYISVFGIILLVIGLIMQFTFVQ